MQHQLQRSNRKGKPISLVLVESIIYFFIQILGVNSIRHYEAKYQMQGGVVGSVEVKEALVDEVSLYKSVGYVTKIEQSFTLRGEHSSLRHLWSEKLEPRRLQIFDPVSVELKVL